VCAIDSRKAHSNRILLHRLLLGRLRL